ncbi:MAG TPA: isoprenyl transferase [Clostridia bacterium]|nr:isoprenyl transferase [Clostridia bacterium]
MRFSFAKMFRSKHRQQDRVLPKHIAIVMDGNGRWAKKKGLPRQAGHSMGANTFRTIARYCNKIGIQYLTVYAFSTENWRRPAEEVKGIMELFREYLIDALTNFRDENIRTRFIGDVSALDENLRKLIREAEESSANKTGLVLNIAVNYGGRQEIVAAARKLAAQAVDGSINADEIDESAVAGVMYTAGQPDPDLIIRPSGELRLSNFLLWQAAYAELWYSDILWPDFRPEHLELAIEDFNRRSRRFGGI